MKEKEKNKFKKVIFDYYLTNREISKEERGKEGYSHKGFTKRERTMIAVLIVLLILLLIKSIAIDPYEPKNSEQEKFVKAVDHIVDEKYNTGGLGMHGVFAYRIIDIKKNDIDHIKEKNIKSDNLESSEAQQGELKESFRLYCGYEAKVRKYFLGVIPVKTFMISIADVPEGQKRDEVRKQDEDID